MQRSGFVEVGAPVPGLHPEVISLHRGGMYNAWHVHNFTTSASDMNDDFCPSMTRMRSMLG